MILILNIKNKNQGAWLLLNKDQIEKKHNFTMQIGEDNFLNHLDKLKINYLDLTGIILYVQEASLTQIKIFTAIVNVLAWQFSLPIVGEYYQTRELDTNLKRLLLKLKKVKKFKPLMVKYKKKAEITISKKHPKYSIIK